MLDENDRTRAPIRSEPAIAVPSEAPRFVIVFWTPPTSGLSSAGAREHVTPAPRDAPRLLLVLWPPPPPGLSSSGTADPVTAPSCEARAPMPRPTRSIGTN